MNIWLISDIIVWILDGFILFKWESVLEGVVIYLKRFGLGLG